MGEIKQQPREKHKAFDGMCYYQDVSLIPNSHGNESCQITSLFDVIMDIRSNRRVHLDPVSLVLVIQQQQDGQ